MFALTQPTSPSPYKPLHLQMNTAHNQGWSFFRKRYFSFPGKKTGNIRKNMEEMEIFRTKLEHTEAFEIFRQVSVL